MGASRAKREMAEGGKIFRNGKYVDKEEWLKAHPTAEMKAVTRKEVKAAVKDEMKRIMAQKQKIVQPDKVIEIPPCECGEQDCDCHLKEVT